MVYFVTCSVYFVISARNENKLIDCYSLNAHHKGLTFLKGTVQDEYHNQVHGKLHISTCYLFIDDVFLGCI